jgi:hypothetical protein
MAKLILFFCWMAIAFGIGHWVFWGKSKPEANAEKPTYSATQNAPQNFAESEDNVSPTNPTGVCFHTVC